SPLSGSVLDWQQAHAPSIELSSAPTRKRKRWSAKSKKPEESTMKTATRDHRPDPGLLRAFKSVGLCGVLLSAGSLLVFDELGQVLSVAVGAALALLNLWMTAYLVRGFIAPSGIRLPWPLIATLKLVLVFGGIYALLQREFLSLLPL